jgi:hypothetical protein
MQDVARRLEDRGIWLLVPDSGSPFAALTQELHLTISERTVPTTQYEQWLADSQGDKALDKPHASRPQSGNLFDMRLLTAASIALLVLAETLLRFRTVMAFEPSRSLQVAETLAGGKRPRRFAALNPLLASARFGLRHFGVVIVHVWVLRLALLVLCVGLIEFPSALTTHLVLPHATRLTNSLPVLPWLVFAQFGAAALVGAIVHTFTLVYDARLYAALS